MLDFLFSGSVVVLAIFILFFILETVFPAREYDKGLKQSTYTTNGLIFAFNTLVTFLLSTSTVWLIADSFSHGYFVEFWNIHSALSLVVGFLILEIAIWYWHKLNHEVLFLWRFHQAHHSELFLNSSSAIRFHIGELLLSVVLKASLVYSAGIPLWIFFIHETAITVFAIAHHANVQLPKRISLLVSYIFITPRMHYAHHSSMRSEHNSNYGVVFSWWDHIFGTINRKEPEHIGLSYTKRYKFTDFLTMPIKRFSTTSRKS